MSFALLRTLLWTDPLIVLATALTAGTTAADFGFWKHGHGCHGSCYSGCYSCFSNCNYCGGCHGCSMSRMTMMDGVQTMLVEQIPAISRVVDVTDHSTGENPYYS